MRMDRMDACVCPTRYYFLLCELRVGQGKEARVCLLGLGCE